ncbi:MAG TPA: methyltransferase domain-containing protein [Caldilineaceae bacterium]|nr:methyltransferase domain-containing protein [Caldilineaceae bacterium]
MTQPFSSEIHYAHGYESSHHAMFRRRSAQKQGAFFLPYLQSGMTLLDCGCGSGTITVGLAEAVMPGQAIGIDVATSEIDVARSSLGESKPANVIFEYGDLYRLGFADATFDALFCHNVLEHLEEPLTALREMYRVLKPGGVMGIRDADMGGTLLHPTNVQLDQWFSLYEADWCGVAGDARFGRRLPGLCKTLPFASILITASFDVYSDPTGIQLIADIGASRCREPDFVQRVIDGASTTRDELDLMQQAWRRWQSEPDAFAAIAHVEVVCHKHGEQRL